MRLKLVCDAGPADDTSGDWGLGRPAPGDRDRVPVRTLEPPGSRYSRRRASVLPGLTVTMLRGAKSGSIYYDGNLAGGGARPTFAMLNGVKMGNMAPAAVIRPRAVGRGRAWADQEAIAALDTRNVLAVGIPTTASGASLLIDLELADGRRARRITTPILCQPPSWLY